MNQPEHWLRGPVEEILPLLQPAAHAMLQARDEVQLGLIDFPEKLLWDKPAGVASVAFHLQHMAGVLDRLFMYANGNHLDAQQLKYLGAEGKENQDLTLPGLFDYFSKQIDKSLEQLHHTTEASLLEIRFVGRKQIPSTVNGLLFHAAEHIQRHTGQLLVTIKMLKVGL